MNYMKMRTFFLSKTTSFYKKNCLLLFIKNSMLQIVIYKKTQFLGRIYTPAAPSIYFVLFQHPEYVLWISSPWIYFTILQHPQYILCSTLVYVKLLLLWALVLATDYLLEFRFEYLWWVGTKVIKQFIQILHKSTFKLESKFNRSYILHNRPFWLLVRSIYDSFKYQGLVSQFTLIKKSSQFFPGIFSIFHLHRLDQWHDLLPIYPGPLVRYNFKLSWHFQLSPLSDFIT